MKKKLAKKKQQAILVSVGKRRNRAKSEGIPEIPPLPVPTIEDHGILLRKFRVELFLYRNLGLKCLHNIVMKILCEHHKLDDDRVVYGRRMSAEDWESGGILAKRETMASNPTYRDTLIRFYTRRYAKQGNKVIPLTNISTQQSTIPWYLDNNPVTLRDSLHGLQRIIKKFALAREYTHRRHPLAPGGEVGSPRSPQSVGIEE